MSAHVSAVLRRQVRQRFLDCCAYCRTAEQLSAATFDIEHIVPRSAGGKTVFENLCLACPTCNRCKADRVAVPDAETNQLVALFHPQRDVWSEHFAWNDDASEIQGLTVTGRASIVALRMNRPQLTRLRRLWAFMDEHPPEFE